MSSVSISKSTLKLILKNILNPDINATNRNIMIEHLINELSSDSVDLLLYLKQIDHVFKQLNIGDHCLVPASYIDSSSYNVDILEDLGIYHGDDFYYGKVTGDSGWRTDFNKASAKLKVDVYLHDDDGKISMKEVEVLHTQLIKTDINRIKHLKDAKD